MAFKKLHPDLLESISTLGFTDPLPFQKKLISTIKSGVNSYAYAPKNSGKSTALVISTLHKLNFDSLGDAPRAIIVVKDKEEALALEEDFKQFTRYSDIRVYSLYEEGKIELQREEVYVGVDIVIATPKRLAKIYFQNGINLNKVQLLVIDDAHFLAKANFTTEIIRISQSMSNTQYIVIAEQKERVFEKFDAEFMEKSRVLK